MDSKHFWRDAPYPPVSVREKNAAYAAKMLSNMGGCISEMSAASLYFYNALALQEHADMAACFYDISLVELKHLEIFGKLALALGADPRLWSQRGTRKLYWSPAFNRYTREPKALLRNAIEAESASIEKYSVQAEQLRDDCVRQILTRIILDEQRHLDAFYSLLEKHS